MGQLVLLIGVVAMMAAGARAGVSRPLTLSTPETLTQAWTIVGATTLSIVILSLAAQWRCSRLGRRIDRTGDAAAARAAFRIVELTRWASLALFGTGLLIGGMLDGVRLILGGNPVLIDEAVTIAPLLLGLVWSWWSIAPIDAKLREASLMGRLDRGEPALPTLSRGAFVLDQIRHQMLIVLVPLTLISLWIELSDCWLDEAGLVLRSVAQTSGALVIIMLMPFALRLIWKTVRISDGELRERLLSVCRRHGVRVSDVLLWRTGSGIANAAVIGFMPRVRFVLLSDGLLERLSDKEVEAVMAHEIGHIRRRHVLWLGGFALSLMTVAWGGATLIAERALIDEQRTQQLLIAEQEAVDRVAEVPIGLAFDAMRKAVEARQRASRAIHEDLDRRDLAAMIGLIVALPVVISGFGFVSRRVERQADAFAAQHLSGLGVAERGQDPDARIEADAALAMASALMRVAHANGMDPSRFAFRHGSIAGRCQHLSELVDQPLKSPAIDRVMQRIKRLTLALIVLAAAMILLA